MTSGLSRPTTAEPARERLPVYACHKTHARAAEIFGGWPRTGPVLEMAAGSGAFARKWSSWASQCWRAIWIQNSSEYRRYGSPLPICRSDCLSMTAASSISRAWKASSISKISSHSSGNAGGCSRPGGRLLISTPNILGLASRWRVFWTGFFPLATKPMNEHRKAPVHDHIHLISYYELRYILRTTGFHVATVTTDRIRKYGLLHSWAIPLVWAATRLALRRERDPRQVESNAEIGAHTLSRAMLFGRTLMVVAHKPA